MTLDAAGAARAATLGVGGAHGTPLHVPEVERVLAGSRGEEAAIREAGEAAARAAEPGGDVHGSADYRRRMVAVLTRRALRHAFGHPEVPS